MKMSPVLVAQPSLAANRISPNPKTPFSGQGSVSIDVFAEYFA